MTLAWRRERETLVGRLDQARTELRASIAHLSDEQMTQPKAVGQWSVKDTLSHAASWKRCAITDIAQLARRGTPIPAKVDLDADAHAAPNNVIATLQQDPPLSQLLQDLDTGVHADLLEAVRSLPDLGPIDAQFARRIVHMAADHDEGHARSILAWRGRERL